MGLLNIIYSTVKNCCPRCHKGRVFEGNNPYSFKNGTRMNIRCSHCGLKYEREVGYFYGAMYASYALQAGVVITLFSLNTLWWNLSNAILLTTILIPIAALFPVTFRSSRIIWIALFTPFEKELAK